MRRELRERFRRYCLLVQAASLSDSVIVHECRDKYLGRVVRRSEKQVLGVFSIADAVWSS
jgi:hypothetical protein